MKIKLRADQMVLVERVLQNIKEDNLVVSPSGSGKSYILAYLEKLLTEQGYLVYVYAPTIEVREQLDELMKGNGSNNKTKGIVEDLNSNNDAPDYLLIDEAHHSEADSYQLLFDKYPNAIKVGFSATPERLDGKGLDNSYQNIIVGKSVRELIDNHILSDYRYYAPSTSKGLQYSISRKYLEIGGEAFFKAVKRDSSYQKKIYADVLKTWLEKGENKQTILFAPSIAMSKKFANEFNQKGIKAKHIEGVMKKADRKETLEAFRKGEIKVVCNVDLISEGFDMSDADCVILTRPTESLAMFMQQAFRAMRYREGKTAIILDHANNIALHGEIDQIFDWSLEGKNARGENEGYERTVWERFNSNAIFDKSVELKEIIKDYNGFYDEKIEEAIKLGNIEGLKILLEIEKQAKIMSIGKYSWAYSFALHNEFDVPVQ
jgi:DNA or RNA helicases of superfamily II